MVKWAGLHRSSVGSVEQDVPDPYRRGADAHARAAGAHLMLSKKFLFKPQTQRDLAGRGDQRLVSNRSGTTGMTETFLERLTRARRPWIRSCSSSRKAMSQPVSTPSMVTGRFMQRASAIHPNRAGRPCHPAIIAQAAATLAQMFPRRFWIAIGSGENLNEHIIGEAWPPKSERNERLLECATIMRRLWAGETVTHQSEWFTMRQARLHLKPLKFDREAAEADPLIASVSTVVILFTVILMLAGLGLMGFANIHRMNGLKNWGAVCMNVVAAGIFAFSGIVNWPVALAMAAGGLLGGYAGARVAQRVGQQRVRRAIVAIGLASFLFLLFRPL